MEEKDRHLPIANVEKIMKSAIPATAKISKDVKELVQECTSEFIFFVTGHAAEKCLNENRKTITGSDILLSLQELGFEHYIHLVQSHGKAWKTKEEEKKN